MSSRVVALLHLLRFSDWSNCSQAQKLSSKKDGPCDGKSKGKGKQPKTQIILTAVMRAISSVFTAYAYRIRSPHTLTAYIHRIRAADDDSDYNASDGSDYMGYGVISAFSIGKTKQKRAASF
jgi:hypothetical protein